MRSTLVPRLFGLSRTPTLAMLTVAASFAACAHSQPATTSVVSVVDPAAPPADGAPAEPAQTPGSTPPEPGTATAPTAGEPNAPVPRLERVDIGKTGLSAYLPKGFPEFLTNNSPDGTVVHNAEIQVGDFAFGCIALRFKVPLGPDDDAEALLTDYLDFLKEQFHITQAAGYGHGHTIESEPSARGVIDFWVDKDGQHYAIGGWSTKAHLAVFYIAGPKDYPLINVQQAYFGGLRFQPVAPAAP